MNLNLLHCCKASFTIFFVFIFTLLSAQQTDLPSCFTDQMRNYQMQSDPEYAQRMNEVESVIYQRTLDAAKSASKAGNEPVVLPVVVHIIHNNGPENISDAAVHEAIASLNDAFAHAGAFAQAGVGVDTKIQFCLARRTPDGLPTTGITRTVSALTELLAFSQDIELKDLMRWDPANYINIWVVKSITNINSGISYAGYATFAFASSSKSDGVVMRADFMNNQITKRQVLPHELGHYFGLYHTFEGGCYNGDCLKDGDRVCDTPPDQATFSSCTFNSCHTDDDSGPFTSDVNDMTENYMDYSSGQCVFRFTEGQNERMHLFLDFFKAKLKESMACLEACPYPVSGGFVPLDTAVVVNKKVLLKNTVPANDNFEWYINGVLTSSEAQFQFTPAEVGQYAIKLIAYDSLSNCKSVTTGRLEALCNVYPYVTGPANLIPGATATYEVAGTNVDSFAWRLDGQIIGTGPALTYTFSSAGNYILEMEAYGDLCSTSWYTYVQVAPECSSANLPQYNYFNAGQEPTLHNLIQTADGKLAAVVDDLDWPFLFKFDKDLNTEWGVRLKSSYSYSYNWAKGFPTNDNGVVITSYSPDSMAVFIVKIDSLGKQQWGTRVKSAVNISRRNFSDCDSNGNCYFLGSVSTGNNQTSTSLTKTGPDGALLWCKAVGGISNFNEDFKIGYDNSIYVCGRNNDTTYITKFDDNGNFIWSRKVSSTLHKGYLIVPEADNGFSLIGSLGGPVITRFDASGNILWAKRYAAALTTNQIEIVNFARKLPNGDYLIGGRPSSPSTGKASIFRLSDTGTVIWSNSVQQYKDLNAIGDSYGMTPDGIEIDGTVIVGLNTYPEGAEGFFRLMQYNSTGSAGRCIETSFTNTVTSIMHSVTSHSITVTDASTGVDSIPDILSLPVYFLLRSTECLNYSTCAEICDNGYDDDKDGLVDCYDTDCNCFTQEPCSIDSITNPFVARLSWQSDSTKNINLFQVPIVGNFNSAEDQKPEILMSSSPILSTVPGSFPNKKAYFFKGDGSNSSSPVINYFSFPNFNLPQVTMAAGDIYKNGFTEIFRVSKYEYQGYTGYTDTVPNTFSSGFRFLFFNSNEQYAKVQIVDFDTDGIPELYVGNAITKFIYPYSYRVGYGKHLIDIDTLMPQGRLAWQNFKYLSASPAAAELLNRNQCGNDPDCNGPELAAGSVIYSIDMDGWDGDLSQRTVERNLNTLDPGPAIWSDGYTAVADINLDNKTDVVVAGKKDDVYGVYAWDINGLIKFFPYPENTPLSGGMPCIANVFDDRTQGFAVDYPEIIAVSRNRLTCFNLNIANQQPNAPYWWSVPTTDPNGYTAATAFDFNADGFEEVVYHDATDLRIIYGGPAPLPAGVDEQRNWFKYYAPTLCSDQYPVIADCDGDNAAEIIFTAWPETGPVAGDSLAGRLIVLESANLPWAGCLPVWNQYGFNPNNVDKNLNIYQHPPGPSTTYSGGKKPFNKFLAQWPTTMDNNFNAHILLPDLSMSIDHFECGDQQLRVDLKVCNDGAAGIQDSVPVCFFSGMPGVMPVMPVTNVQYITKPIRQQECVVQSLWLPVAESPSAFYAVLNTTNTTDPLYANLQTTGVFPQAVNMECGYHNNFLPFTWSWPRPTLDLGPDVTICNGNSYQIIATPGFKEYIWDNGYTGPQFTAEGPGAYILTAKDQCGFPQTDTLSILPDLSHVIDLGADLVICPGDSVVLFVPGFDELAWWPGEQTGCSDCNAIVLNPTFSNTYIITGVAGSCFSTDEIQITVNPEITLTGGSTPATNNDPTGTAWVVVSGLSGPYSFEWSTSPAAVGDTIYQLLPGNYTVTVTDKNGCSEVLVVTVEQTIAAAELPAGNAIFLTPNPATEQFRVLWESPENLPYQLEAVDEQGKKMIARKLKMNQAELIDCALWPAGSYTVYFSLDQKVYARQIVVIK